MKTRDIRKQFLDYFNLKSLEHLPALGEIKDLAQLDPELELSLAEPPVIPAATSAANDEHSDHDFELDQQIDGVESESDQSSPSQDEDSVPVDRNSAPINE